MSVIVNCPHCNQLVFVAENELNCCIFRCGIYKDTYQQIDPHLNKERCDYLSNNNLVYGCAKPFQILKNIKNEYIVQKCDYI